MCEVIQVMLYNLRKKVILFGLFIGVSANIDSTLRNRAPESPISGAITKITPTRVQWNGFTLEECGVNFSKLTENVH